ncbi:gamma-glutamyltransferase [Acidomonas methanolica]|uniref:gamma-glutamyltransferase n=2 Tax=Acidomonas methanolica TaxID=437 RepID=UPI0005AB7B40|nr:gamma-glutamyltransferase [Acidomonas methanolica]TCS29245.1 gamma-glutamyltranspeptidase/glutathione hydrolase [Acidomonas methanolica]
MVQRRQDARQKFRRSRLIAGALASTVLFLSGCGGVPQGVAIIGHDLFGHTSNLLTGYVGAVVADEPQAALAGQDVLARGGNAADAAATVAMALAVTLPSRASLGGGGACIASRPKEAPHSFLFLPVAPSGAGASKQGDRPAAVPMTPRGIFLMQLRYGSVDFADTLRPAIRLARAGITVSRALSSDIAAVHNALFADEVARSIFSRVDGTPLQSGDELQQPELANFIERLARMGVGDLYNGALSGIFAEAATQAGGDLSPEAMRAALPVEGPSLRVAQGETVAYFLPPPADGGFGAAAMLRGASANGAVAAWRAAHGAQGGDLVAQAQAMLDGGEIRSGGSLPALPASTSFLVTDRQGNAVACALTDNNLFGTGRVTDGMGVVLAASPARVVTPLLGASIVESRGALRGVAASSGQNDAAEALGAAVGAILNGRPVPHRGSGRVNAAICGTDGECVGETDPRGSGLAVGTRTNGRPGN